MSDYTLTCCYFAGRQFRFVRMHSKPQRNYPGYVVLATAEGVEVTARADMVIVKEARS